MTRELGSSRPILTGRGISTTGIAAVPRSARRGLRRRRPHPTYVCGPGGAAGDLHPERGRIGVAPELQLGRGRCEPSSRRPSLHRANVGLWPDVITRPAQAQHAAQAAVKSHAQGEMTLPPLPPIELPFIRKEPRPRLQRMHQGWSESWDPPRRCRSRCRRRSERPASVPPASAPDSTRIPLPRRLEICDT